MLEMPAEFLVEDLLQYAVSYQPVQQEGSPEIRIWHEPLSLGQPLPELPLPLDKGQCVPLDLEATYEQTCLRMRLPSEET